MTEAPAASSVHSLTAEPARRVGRRWIALIALANLGLYLAYLGPLSVLLPNQIQAIAGSGHKVAVLGWVTGVGAAVAMISNPVAGALSDRTTGRFGRRRPWVVCGALAGAAALVFLGGQHAIVGVLAGWCLAQAALNAMQASLSAAVPDHVPVVQRGAVSGWIGLPQSLGVLLAVVLVTDVVTGNAGYALLAALPRGVRPALRAHHARPAAVTRRTAALAVAGLRQVVLAEPAALPRLRVGLADQVRDQPRQRDDPAVPAVLPA